VHVLDLIALVLVLILGRGIFLYFRPWRECRWCRPGGVLGGSWLARLAGHEPKRRPKRGCWRCSRRRQTRRWGAWHVHKVKDSLIRAWQERGMD
jgi:hypothetical protein